jgi:uncharacterized protein (DUF58 family)
MSAGVTIDLDALVMLQADAHGFSLNTRQPAGSLLAGRHASRLRGRGLAFDELRRYAPGDDVRTIDWRSTARLRVPHVRVYDEERERPVLLLVDQRRPMFFGSRHAMKSVTAAEVAALGAWRALAAGDRVGAVVFGDDELVELRPHRSRNRVLRVLHEVSRLNQALRDAPPATASVTLNDALQAALRRKAHNQLVVLISDLDGADADTQRLATLLAAHNDVLVIAVYDPLGASLRVRPGMFADLGGEHFELPLDPGFPAAFRREFERVALDWVGIFRALRVPLLPVSSAAPAAQQLRALFGHPAASP